jgi:hypothetical protein
MSRGRKLGLLLFAAVGFGVLVAVIKGQEAGVRSALGNMSAPWMLVPFLLIGLGVIVFVLARAQGRAPRLL